MLTVLESGIRRSGPWAGRASGEGCLSSAKAALSLHPGMTLLGVLGVLRWRERAHTGSLRSLLPRALTRMDPLT